MKGGELLILIAVLAVFWLLMMRPARNQRRAMQQLQKSLSVGDRVVISAGIYGTVQSVEEGKVELEIAPDTVVTVATQVVVRRAEDEASDEEDSGADTDAEQDRPGAQTAQPAADEEN